MFSSDEYNADSMDIDYEDSVVIDVEYEKVL
jgi:hypothetical protein